MKNLRHRWWSLLVCMAAGLAVVVRPAQASTRNYLTVEGRVFDHLGRRLSDTWVICTGSRRASVPVDSLGRYHLEIPGATLEELERTPLKIRIQARKKGYRFALSNGAPELGLEMRVVKDESPLSRLRVRSNDSSAVSAVAGSVVLDANPRALLTAEFVGSPGAQYDTPAVPLEESDEITLAGSSQSIPELAVSEPVAPPPARARTAAPARTPAPVRTPAPATPTATAGTPGKPSPVTLMPPVMTPPDAGRDSASNIRMPVVLARPPANDTPAPVPPAPGEIEPQPLPASQPGDAEPRRWNAGGSDRDSKPRVVRPGLDPETPEPARSKPREKQPRAADPAKRVSAHRGPFTIRVRPVSPDSAKGAPGSDPAVEMSGTDAAPGPETLVPTPAAVVPREAADPGLRPVLPKDMPAERVTPGAQPPIQRVPSAPGVPAPVQRRAPATTVAPMCDCTIRGTVEVQWDRPLTSRTEVVIAVEDAPEISASAELFMGSPRAFEIRPAPCGVHRLLLWTRSKQRFVLVSQEPRVVCTPGGVQQMRLVLEPVARWGAAQ